MNFFKKKSFRNTIRVSNSLDPVQDRHNVGPDLGPDCLQDYQQTMKVAASKEIVYHDSSRHQFCEIFHDVQGI